MAGRPKQKIYQYSAEGKYLQEYSSISEIHDKYYNGSKYPLFGVGSRSIPREYHELPDGTYIAKYRIGRDELLRQLRIDNCQYCVREHKKDRAVEVYNLLGDKIAEYKNLRIAKLMCPINADTMTTRLLYGEKPPKKDDNLIFKFKENDI